MINVDKKTGKAYFGEVQKRLQTDNLVTLY